MCWEDRSRLVSIVLAAAVLALLLAAPAILMARARGDHWPVASVWIGAIALGGALAGLGFAVNPDDVLVLWFASLALGAAAGWVIGVRRGRRTPSLAIVGLLGGGTPVVGAFAAFLGLLAVTGNCLD
jgi:hypothetical protein